MKVLRAPNPSLRAETKTVQKITPGLLQTLREMVKLTKTFKDPEGVGLASTQVGLDGKFFVAKKVENTSDVGSDPLREASSSEVKDFNIVINPEITWTSKRSKVYFEGCLSIPNYWGEVERFLMVKVKYLKPSGEVVQKTLKGLEAHIFQHEIDHLNGILFIDKVMQQKGKFYKVTGKDKTGADIFEEVGLTI